MTENTEATETRLKTISLALWLCAIFTGIGLGLAFANHVVPDMWLETNMRQGEQAFLAGKPESSCPFDEPRGRTAWLIGYRRHQQ